MKHIIPPLFVAAVMVAPCLAAPSPASLSGKTVMLNYTQSQYCYEEEDEPSSGWQSYKAAQKNLKGCAELFIMMGLKPKATRNLLPITAPGKGGKYTYRKTGADTGTIEVNMAPMDAGRTITMKFTGPNTAIATEEVGAGCMVNTIRNIQVIIK
ncbi:MAG: hypothetical protein IJ985_07215 [Akkermansia sp.]|nr:hypothetical protein [Akkermansia sp.]